MRGTGKGAALEGYSVAGKTGTAQKYDAGLGRYSNQKTTASFVGYLPAQQPRAAILVSLDEPQGEMAWGGVAAAPVFRSLAEHTMRLLRVPPEDSQTYVLEDSLTTMGRRDHVGAALPTLSAWNFVENMRDLLQNTWTQIGMSTREHFFSIDPNEARKSRKKADRAAKQ
jgi:cell division protein FtsI (penicillin-binding protein 3)